MRSNNVLGFIFAATLDDKIPELASSIRVKSQLDTRVVETEENTELSTLTFQICQTQVSAM